MDDFSWLVGIFEGEGWFGLKKRTSKIQNKTYIYYYPHMSITMTDEDIIRRLSFILKHEHYRTFTPSGKNVKGETYKTAHRLSICGSKAMYIAEKMEPFLSERRKEQIKYARENQSRKTTYKEGYTPVVKKQTNYGLMF
jgi:hypothetical protein